MHRQFLFVLFASAIAMSQGAQPAEQVASQAQSSAPATQQTPTPRVAPETPAEVLPTDPVITLHGFCPDKPGSDTKSPACQTVITREDFEHLAETLSPNMPAAAKQKLASDYSQMLVFASEARKRGLDKSQHFNDLVEFLKLQLLAQELFRGLQDEAKPTQADIEKYYNENSAKFEELSLKRLLIPRNRPGEPAAAKKPGAISAAPKPLTDTELQAEGDKIRARLVTGGDFDIIQKEIYTSAGIKTPPPTTALPKARRESLPPSEQSLFDLKANEFSKVMIEPAGAYIYQVGARKVIPLADVQKQIEATLTNEHMAQQMTEIRSGIKPEVNQAYFRHLGAEAAASAGAQAPVMLPPPAPKTSKSPAATPK